MSGPPTTDNGGVPDTGLGPAFPAVLDAARANAPWAFERIYRAYATPVHGYLRSQGLADPDDLHGEVFLRAFRALGRFDGTEAQLRSWLFSIAHNLIIDERRRQTRQPVAVPLGEREAPAAGPGLPSAPDTAEVALGRLGTGDVAAVLATLPELQRDVLLLRVIADLTIDEIAAAIGRSPGAVKALQHRALEGLRRRFSSAGRTPLAALDVHPD